MRLMLGQEWDTAGDAVKRFPAGRYKITQIYREDKKIVTQLESVTGDHYKVPADYFKQLFQTGPAVESFLVAKI